MSSQSRTRECVASARLTPADLVLVEAAAEKLGRSRSTFIGTAAKRWAAEIVRDQHEHPDEESDDAGAD